MQNEREMKTTTKLEYLQLLLGSGAEAKLLKVKCEGPNCDGDDIKSWQFIHKSADEGESTIFKCRKCGYVWIQEDQ